MSKRELQPGEWGNGIDLPRPVIIAPPGLKFVVLGPAFPECRKDNEQSCPESVAEDRPLLSETASEGSQLMAETSHTSHT
jgi:hypothetical protein